MQMQLQSISIFIWGKIIPAQIYLCWRRLRTLKQTVKLASANAPGAGRRCGGKERRAAGQGLLAAHGLPAEHKPCARSSPSPPALAGSSQEMVTSRRATPKPCGSAARPKPAGDPDRSSYSSRSTSCSWNLLLPTGRARLTAWVRNKTGYFLLKQMRSAAVLQR